VPNVVVLNVKLNGGVLTAYLKFSGKEIANDPEGTQEEQIIGALQQ